VILTRRVDDVFFVVTTEGRNILDIRKERDLPVDDEEVEVPFWLLLDVCDDKSVKVRYYLPEELNTDHLNSEVIKKSIREHLKVIERRINQTILLKQVFDTRYCPASLMPPDEEDIEAPKPNKNKARKHSRVIYKKPSSEDVT
jgi:hypothetical protein